MSDESAGEGAVDSEHNLLLSRGVLQNCPTARSVFEEQLTEARRAVRGGLDNWSASCKRNNEDVQQLKRLQEAQKEWQAKFTAISEELAPIEKLMHITEELGHNQHLVNMEHILEKAEGLRESLRHNEVSAQRSEEQLAQLVEVMSTRRDELTSLRRDAGRCILKLDMVTRAMLELSQTASVRIPQLAKRDSFLEPSSTDRLLGSLSPGQQIQLSGVFQALKQAKRIVALVGAGISTSAGSKPSLRQA